RDLSLSARVHQRYRLIEQVLNGHSLAEAADRVGCHFTVVYDWIHRFNESGFASFEQVSNPKGRPPILRAEQLRELVEVALSNPQERGLPFSNWSVPKLGEYCRSRRLLPPVTDEWIRRLLRREGLTPQRIRTWKTSSDPDFDRKKN
ncbi:MAG TPA: helix-turn-helix domain-containing protein, partial [Bryobacteraceae bacterium]|nr:helix-turn-helix domain-containing protein [Bryobacteraceae bacterium]